MELAVERETDRDQLRNILTCGTPYWTVKQILLCSAYFPSAAAWVLIVLLCPIRNPLRSPSRQEEDQNSRGLVLRKLSAIYRGG